MYFANSFHNLGIVAWVNSR